MDAQHNHLDLKIKSVHQPHVAHITVEVLINCDCGPQYFPNLGVAKLVSVASTWHGKKGQWTGTEFLMPTSAPPRLLRKSCQEALKP